MWHIYNQAMRYADRLDISAWLIVLIAVVGIGLFCMRGFGSRSGY